MNKSRFKRVAAVMMMGVVGCGGSSGAPKVEASKPAEITVVEVSKSAPTTKPSSSEHRGAAPSVAAKKEKPAAASAIILPDPDTDVIGAKGPDLPLR